VLQRRIQWLIVAGLLGAAACGGDGGGGDDGDDTGDDGGDDGGGAIETELFPADYADTFTEVRDCRMSIEHATTIRVLAAPDAVSPYENRDEAFPEGAVVLKEEYEYGSDCTGPIQLWTVMKRAPEGTADATLGWIWEEVDADRNVVETDGPTCVGCHESCGVPPDGYEATCAVP
jgi:Cytochrome P460